jgi:ferric-dicitrate binding protein FerR (iron transport regulator)
MLSIVLVGAAAWNAVDVERTAPRTLARIVALSAPATTLTSDGVVSEVNLGAAITTSMQLHTRSGRGALAMGDSLSLRLDTDTRVRFEDENQIRLLAGAIYVDSGGLNAASHLRILTPAGEVRHEGTQYQVVVTGELTQIKVREGRVHLMLATGNATPIPVAAGEQIHVDDLIVSKRSVPSFGPDWDWASTMATPIDVDNRPLIEFLAWITREHGWQLRYASAAEERAVQSIRLHGSAKADTPAQTLKRVSLMTGLSMEVEDGILTVGPRRGPKR